MSQGIKLIAVLCCLAPWLGAGIMAIRKASVSEVPVTRETFHAQQQASQSSKTRGIALLVVVEIGAVLLFVDAIRRDYEAPRGWPIAIAVLGLMSFGTASLVYYAIWGWQATRRTFPLADDFCAACKAETSEISAPSLAMHNLLGAQFLGSAQRCGACGSCIRTVWFSIVLPLIPFGSYRVMPVGKALAHRSEFRSRKAKWRILHLLEVYGFVAATLVVLFWLARS